VTVWQDRPYQRAYLDDIRANWKSGRKRVLMVAPTGAGKSRCLGMMAEGMVKRSAEAGRPFRMLLLAERRRLVEQLAGQMKSVGIPWHVEMANLPDGETIGNEWVRRDHNAPVWVGSRDTILSRSVRNDWVGLPKFDLLVVDECVTGDSVVITESGPVPISELRSMRSTHVLSEGPNGPRFSRIMAFLPRGVKRCMTVTLSSGKTLRCTENHPLFTQRGWVIAGNLNTTDRVLSLAGVDAVNLHPLELRVSLSTSVGTSGAKSISLPNCCESESSTMNYSATPRTADVDVGCNSSRGLHPLNSSLSGGKDTLADISKVTAGDPTTGPLNSPLQSDRQYSARYSETQAFCTRTTRPLPQGCRLTTQLNRQSGRVTNNECCIGWVGGSESATTAMDTAGQSLVRHQRVCDHSWRYTTCVMFTARSVSARNGWMVSAESALRGGSETTEVQVVESPYSCTPKGSHEKPWKSLPTGSDGNTASVVLLNHGRTTRSVYSPTHGLHSGKTSPIMSPTACSTRWERVVGLTKNVSSEDVYDITVEDDHNFYANGMLVHNCHLWERGKSRQLMEMVNAPFVIGATATPCYGDGTGLGKQNWDAIVECVTMRQLIAEKVLVPVRYFAPPELAKKRKAGEKTGVSGDPVKHWMDYAEGRRTVAFLQGVDQAKAVRDRFRKAGVTAEVIDADTPHTERNRIFDDIKAGKVLWCGSVGTLTTGVDVPEWEVAQLLIKCGSFSKYRQIGGRVMRACPAIGKEYAIFLDHSGAVLEHGFFDEPVPWELEENEDVADRVKKEREQGERANPVCCAKCGCLFAGSPVCPECGAPIPRRERTAEPDIHRELLVEINANQETAGQFALRKQREWTVFLRMCSAKGWPAKRANVMFKSKFGDWPENMGVTPTFDRADRDTPVSELCPNLVRKKAAN
jgi:superfamily II DNA or RNA helicase